MKYEKFETELTTLRNFFTVFCHDKHSNQEKTAYLLHYKGQDYSFSLELCPECIKLINYSFTRLKVCPHDEKPKCRICANPCYDKKEWKRVASVMRYSGTKAKVQQVKDFFSFKKELKIS